MTPLVSNGGRMVKFELLYGGWRSNGKLYGFNLQNGGQMMSIDTISPPFWRSNGKLYGFNLQ